MSALDYDSDYDSDATVPASPGRRSLRDVPDAALARVAGYAPESFGSVVRKFGGMPAGDSCASLTRGGQLCEADKLTLYYYPAYGGRVSCTEWCTESLQALMPSFVADCRRFAESLPSDWQVDGFVTAVRPMHHMVALATRGAGGSWGVPGPGAWDRQRGGAEVTQYRVTVSAAVSATGNPQERALDIRVTNFPHGWIPRARDAWKDLRLFWSNQWQGFLLPLEELFLKSVKDRHVTSIRMQAWSIPLEDRAPLGSAAVPCTDAGVAHMVIGTKVLTLRCKRATTDGRWTELHGALLARGKTLETTDFGLYPLVQGAVRGVASIDSINPAQWRPSSPYQVAPNSVSETREVIHLAPSSKAAAPTKKAGSRYYFGPSDGEEGDEWRIKRRKLFESTLLPGVAAWRMSPKGREADGSQSEDVGGEEDGKRERSRKKRSRLSSTRSRREKRKRSRSRKERSRSSNGRERRRRVKSRERDMS